MWESDEIRELSFMRSYQELEYSGVMAKISNLKERLANGIFDDDFDKFMDFMTRFKEERDLIDKTIHDLDHEILLAKKKARDLS